MIHVPVPVPAYAYAYKTSHFAFNIQPSPRPATCDPQSTNGGDSLTLPARHPLVPPLVSEGVNRFRKKKVGLVYSVHIRVCVCITSCGREKREKERIPRFRRVPKSEPDNKGDHNQVSQRFVALHCVALLTLLQIPGDPLDISSSGDGLRSIAPKRLKSSRIMSTTIAAARMRTSTSSDSSGAISTSGGITRSSNYPPPSNSQSPTMYSTPGKRATPQSPPSLSIPPQAQGPGHLHIVNIPPPPVPPALANSPHLQSPNSMFRRPQARGPRASPAAEEEAWLRDTVPMPNSLSPPLSSSVISSSGSGYGFGYGSTGGGSSHTATTNSVRARSGSMGYNPSLAVPTSAPRGSGSGRGGGSGGLSVSAGSGGHRPGHGEYETMTMTTSARPVLVTFIVVLSGCLGEGLFSPGRALTMKLVMDG
ncbi:hypothetical protein PNOK_0028600 [Pyrrhoderma noxium]|uniref:Uncharacterized protein n=1 Tax=Pyrrhoderma noxium TaxID=2282107 RepID=A0A286UUG3_9AGAM|nr:hypothetical protein PNOK_0028600 [Pyrrhoderma noxium]